MASAPLPAVVLAAGASQRLGQPKALVRLGNLTLIEWAYWHLTQAGCAPVILVVHPDLASPVRALLPEAEVVVNHDYAHGRTGSLQRGLHHLSERDGRPSRLVMAPVDRPGWNATLVRTLVGVAGSVVPCHEGKKGHPVVLDEGAISAVERADAATPLRALVDFQAVEVHAPWLALNVDTPVEMTALTEQSGALLAYFREGEGI